MENIIVCNTMYYTLNKDVLVMKDGESVYHKVKVGDIASTLVQLYNETGIKRIAFIGQLDYIKPIANEIISNLENKKLEILLYQLNAPMITYYTN